MKKIKGVTDRTMNLASEKRQATNRPLMMSIFLFIAWWKKNNEGDFRCVYSMREETAECVFVSVCVSILLFLFISRTLPRSVLTELPLMFPISFSLLNTPAAFRLAGANIILWLLRELSATNPRSPFSWASALILSSCRPGNNSKKSQSCWRDVISCMSANTSTIT